MLPLVHFYQRATKLFEHGLIAPALAVVTRVLDRFPEEGRFWELAGVIYHAQQDHERALFHLETASTLVPLSARAEAVLAAEHWRSGRVELARDAFIHLASRTDLPTALLAAVAAGLGRTGHPCRALEVCREAARRLPEADEAWYAMAYYMSRLAYPVETVLRVMERALALDPRCVMYRVAVALLCDRAGDVRRAYHFLSGLEVEELVALRCPRCVDRLASIFARAGDAVRHGVCRDRRAALPEPSAQGESA